MSSLFGRACLVAVALASLASLWVYPLYRRDLDELWEQVLSGGTVVQTECGPVEYAESGEGPPVLIVHGAGGGYDQGQRVARILGQGFRWITPSRFGFLGTPLPEGASTPGQADAHACLLDALGIDRLPVIGVSAGGPSSLQLALRHPERCTALVLLSAVTLADPPRSLPMEGVFRAVLRSDLSFWLVLELARKPLRSLLGVDADLQERLSPEELALTDEFLRSILPISAKRDGILFDLTDLITAPPYPIERIRTPTLVVHARDDSLVPFAHAEHAAGRIPGARLVAIEEGGHMAYTIGSDAVPKVRAFLRGYASSGAELAPAAAAPR